MRPAAGLFALLLVAAAPVAADAPGPREVVAACIALTQAALQSAEGTRRARLEADLDLMRNALKGLDLLDAHGAASVPPMGRLPQRLEECSDAG